MANPALITPDNAQRLALIARMELIARRAVEGFLSGLHPSPYFGSSVEYADHRPYSPGDEIRRIDWKLAAKTDKHYLKLFEEQTNTRATIIVDASRSMAYAGPDSPADKLTFARHLAAALAYLMVRQHDAVGLAIADESLRHLLPPRATPRHFRRLLDDLADAKPDRPTAIGAALQTLAARLPRRGIVILISDLIDDPDSIATGLSLLKHQKHDLIVLHLADRAELTFPYEKLTRFKDIEGERMILASGRSVRDAYLTRLQKHLDSVRRLCLERDIAHELLVTDLDYDRGLSSYLAKRRRITG